MVQNLGLLNAEHLFTSECHIKKAWDGKEALNY